MSLKSAGVSVSPGSGAATTGAADGPGQDGWMPGGLARARWLILLEPLAVFACAVLLYIYQNFFSATPKLALLFDSQGYLSAALGLTKLITPQFVVSTIGYCLHGFAEGERLRLYEWLANSAGALELLKTGPALPLFLAIGYTAAGKAAIPSNWQIAVYLMIFLQALSALLMYLIARFSCKGRSVARIVAVLVFSYSAFTLNSGRPISELVALFGVALWLFSVLWLVSKVESALDQQELPISAGLWSASGLCGFASAFLALSRPSLVLLPLVPLGLLPGILGGRRFARLLLPLILPFVASGLLTLGPWALAKQIASGYPSLTVDRYGAYNLFAGCDLENDGLDLLPGSFVAHPDTFRLSMTETVHRIAASASEHPLSCLNLLIRKIPRLADSPWNDFQVSCLGVPWSLQVWWHQILLLWCGIGFFCQWNQLPASSSRRQRSGVVLCGCVLTYQLINCLFITMRRYFYPALPAVILLAALGINFAFSGLSRKNRWLLIVSSLLPPAVSLSLTSFSGWQTPLLPALARTIDVPAVAVGAATLMALSITACLITAMAVIRPRLPVRLALLAVGSLVCLCAFFSTRHTVGGLEFPCLLSAQRPALTVSIPLPPGSEKRRWFLVLDLAGSLVQATEMRDLEIKVNGVAVRSGVRPWLSVDKSSRESFLYETAFAYSSGRRLEELRQWSCLEIPEGLIRLGQGNEIQLATAGKQPVFLLADIWNDQRIENHVLSLREFSWTKGFLVGPCGDMRMDKWVRRRIRDGMRSGPYCQPRVYLVASPSSRLQQVSDSGEHFYFAGGKVGCGSAQRLLSFQAHPALAVNASLLRSLKANAMQYRVEGKVRARAGRALASVCLIEKNSLAADSATQFAPLAPMDMPVTESWSRFSFIDEMPLSLSRAADSTVAIPAAASLELLLSGRNWWELLDYGSSKSRGQIEFADVCLQSQPTVMADFSRPNWRSFACEGLR